MTVKDGRYTAVRHVHTSTPQLKGRVRAMYTSVYTTSIQSCTWQVGLLPLTRAETARYVWERVHGPVGLPAVYTAQTALVYTADYTGRFGRVRAM